MPSLLADIPDDSLGDLFREITRARLLAAEAAFRSLKGRKEAAARGLHAELTELREDVRREIESRRLRRPPGIRWEDQRDSWLREAEHWLADADEDTWASDGEELIRTARDLLAEQR